MKTANIELAAALLARGQELIAIETEDGVVAQFIFEPSDTVELMARSFHDDTLMVSASSFAHHRRELIVKVRKALDGYKREARIRMAI